MASHLKIKGRLFVHPNTKYFVEFPGAAVRVGEAPHPAGLFCHSTLGAERSDPRGDGHWRLEDAQDDAAVPVQLVEDLKVKNYFKIQGYQSTAVVVSALRQTH